MVEKSHPSRNKSQTWVDRALHVCLLWSFVATIAATMATSWFEACDPSPVGRRIEQAPASFQQNEPVDYFQSQMTGAPLCRSLSPDDIDFTLVTQLSPSRLPLMREHCRRWGSHPISIAMATKLSKDAVLGALSSLGCDIKLLSVHVVQEFGSDHDYPINLLRNLAFSGVRTSHAIYLDVDFLPSRNLYESLKQHGPFLTDHKTALVVPAFELQQICDPHDPDCKQIHKTLIPENKQKLLEYFKPNEVDSTIIQFDFEDLNGGHSSTRYLDWITQPNDQLIPIECIMSSMYEPYLVLQYCEDLPPFQEAFRGYGKNKITWFRQLHRTGYRLYQTGDSFLVHLPHLKSAAFKLWSHTKRDYGRRGLEVEQTAQRFQAWMEATIPNKAALPPCQNISLEYGLHDD